MGVGDHQLGCGHETGADQHAAAPLALGQDTAGDSPRGPQGRGPRPVPPIIAALDTNKDGAISGGELTGFQQWDADWPEDYAGDMVVEIGGQKIPLERPSDWAAEWHDGRAVSIHTRRLADPVEVAGAASPQILIRAYDPDYYVAYTITAEPEFTGREDCKAQVFEPDIDAIPDELREAIAELSADTTPEAAGLTGAGLSAVGEMYAEEVHATCGG